MKRILLLLVIGGGIFLFLTGSLGAKEESAETIEDEKKIKNSGEEMSSDKDQSSKNKVKENGYRIEEEEETGEKEEIEKEQFKEPVNENVKKVEIEGRKIGEKKEEEEGTFCGKDVECEKDKTEESDKNNGEIKEDVMMEVGMGVGTGVGTSVPTNMLMITQTVEKGGVVINELAWMGTDNSSNDEWIELRNLIDEEVNLDGWTLEAKDGIPGVDLFGRIAADDYFLLERTDDTSVPGVKADLIYTGALSNSGEVLELKNEEGKVIDRVDGSNGWIKGDNNDKHTMEKTGDGWQDSEKPGGTPRKKNSSGRGDEEPEESNWQVFFNEILANPNGVDKGSEWLELYNLEDEKVVLDGWEVKNGAGKKMSLAGIELKAKELLQIGSGNGFSIRNESETLFLFDSEKRLVDEVKMVEYARSGIAWVKDRTEDWSWSRKRHIGAFRTRNVKLTQYLTGFFNIQTYEQEKVSLLSRLKLHQKRQTRRYPKMAMQTVQKEIPSEQKSCSNQGRAFLFVFIQQADFD